MRGGWSGRRRPCRSARSRMVSRRCASAGDHAAATAVRTPCRTPCSGTCTRQQRVNSRQQIPPPGGATPWWISLVKMGRVVTAQQPGPRERLVTHRTAVPEATTESSRGNRRQQTPPPAPCCPLVGQLGDRAAATAARTPCHTPNSDTCTQ